MANNCLVTNNYAPITFTLYTSSQIIQIFRNHYHYYNIFDIYILCNYTRRSRIGRKFWLTLFEIWIFYYCALKSFDKFFDIVIKKDLILLLEITCRANSKTFCTCIKLKISITIYVIWNDNTHVHTHTHPHEYAVSTIRGAFQRLIVPLVSLNASKRTTSLISGNVHVTSVLASSLLVDNLSVISFSAFWSRHL